ncbi:hypothetical protein F5Y11DRAFT_149210 [Daldinia sp. FL1419]|nr:hypothetical protein F5Y11DRAFT_149210 [Daldinia sp. FL1419]
MSNKPHRGIRGKERWDRMKRLFLGSFDGSATSIILRVFPPLFFFSSLHRGLRSRRRWLRTLTESLGTKRGGVGGSKPTYIASCMGSIVLVAIVLIYDVTLGMSD